MATSASQSHWFRRQTGTRSIISQQSRELCSRHTAGQAGCAGSQLPVHKLPLLLVLFHRTILFCSTSVLFPARAVSAAMWQYFARFARVISVVATPESDEETRQSQQKVNYLLLELGIYNSHQPNIKSLTSTCSNKLKYPAIVSEILHSISQRTRLAKDI